MWSFEVERLPAREAQAFARRVEELGFPVLWIPESAVSKEVFTQATLLLSATERLVVATGIANIWARDAVAMRNGERALAEAFPRRFLLGLGVSHEPAVRRRGGTYKRQLQHMRGYLDAMDAARYSGPEPAHPPDRVLAALGPKMLDLARERTAGAHPYFVPVEHTAFARQRLGADPLLAWEQAVCLETTPSAAREIAKRHMAGYLRLDNYANNLRRLGWTAADLAGPTDALVDAVVAHGDAAALAERVRAHHAAGADHVCLQVLGDRSPRVLEELSRSVLLR
ncbi:TIGR03620 family F420-dependent LLM class oxidoreductase [soil metagenome]